MVRTRAERVGLLHGVRRVCEIGDGDEESGYRAGAAEQKERETRHTDSQEEAQAFGCSLSCRTKAASQDNYSSSSCPCLCQCRGTWNVFLTSPAKSAQVPLTMEREKGKRASAPPAQCMSPVRGADGAKVSPPDRLSCSHVTANRKSRYQSERRRISIQFCFSFCAMIAYTRRTTDERKLKYSACRTKSSRLE